MIQLIIPNYNIPYTGGYCEKFIENTTGQNGVWGAAVTPVPPYSYTGAWESNFGNGNHPNEKPPKGLRVAVYFSLGSNPEGHVALQLEDGRVASSTQAGYHTTAYIHPNMQDLINVYAKANNGCKYLGYSEYIGKLKVIGENMKPTKQEVYDRCKARGFEPSEAEKDKWIAMTYPDFMTDLEKAYPFDSICKVKFVKVGDLYVKE